MDRIQITKDLKFGYADLMKEVDTSHEFTLRDVLRACVNSDIPEALGSILQCPYIYQYWEEAKSKDFENDKEDSIEYLRVYWSGNKDEWEGKRADTNSWNFDGVGKKGVVSDDVKKFYKMTAKQIAEFQERYAVEFSPMYKIADLPIKIDKKMSITDHFILDKCIKKKYKGKKNIWDVSVDFQPSITLIELLYAIFWELSFCGSPEARDNKVKELNGMVDEIKKAEKEGRLDEVTVPWDKAKKDILAKIKKKK